MYYEITLPNVGGTMLKKNVSSERFSWLVNKYGIVKIDSVIYQNRKNVTKQMYPANDSYLMDMLEATSNDFSKGIKVINTGWNPLGKTQICEPNTFYNNDAWGEFGFTTFSTKGKLCIDLQVGLNKQLDLTCQDFYKPQLDATVSSSKRTITGKWVQDLAYLTFSITFLQNFNSPAIDGNISTNGGLLSSQSGSPAFNHTHKIAWSKIKLMWLHL